MRTRIINDFQSLNKDDWDTLLKKSGADNLFLTYEWLAAWWETFGAGQQLFIVVVEEENSLAAIAPLMITAQRKLQFIAPEISDYLDFIVVGDPAKCFSLIFKVLLDNLRAWDWAEFLYLPGDSLNLPYWEKSLAKLPVFGRTLKKASLAVPLQMYRGTNNWEELEKTLPSKRRLRYELRRKYSKMVREQGAPVLNRIKDLPGIRSEFDHLIKHHSLRWAAGSGSQFVAPLTLKHYLNVAAKFAPRGWVELSGLKLGEEYVALVFGFSYNGKYYYYTPAYNHNFWEYSPGNQLIKQLLIAFYAEGKIKVFDLLRGDEAYKFDWSRDELPLYRARIYPFKPRGVFYFLSHWLISKIPRRIKRLKSRLPKALKIDFGDLLRRRAKVLAGYLFSSDLFIRLYLMIRKRGPQILLYHGVSDRTNEKISCGTVDYSMFERQLEYLKKYHVNLPLAEVVAARREGRKLPANGISITFDDGYDNHHRCAAPLLKEYGFTAAFFICSEFAGMAQKGGPVVFWWDIIDYIMSRDNQRDFIAAYEKNGLVLPQIEDYSKMKLYLEKSIKLAEPAVARRIAADLTTRFKEEIRSANLPAVLNWDKVRAMRTMGMEIGGHTASHVTASKLPGEKYREELVESKAEIEAQLGEPIGLFAFPYGGRDHYSPEVVQAVKDANYDCALLALGISDAEETDPFCLNRTTIAKDDDFLTFKIKASGIYNDLKIMYNWSKGLWGKKQKKL